LSSFSSSLSPFVSVIFSLVLSHPFKLCSFWLQTSHHAAQSPPPQHLVEPMLRPLKSNIEISALNFRH
jgi:hypothetical protein